MAGRYKRDSRGRFASSGASGAASRRNRRRMANLTSSTGGQAMKLQDQAMAGSRNVKLSAPERGSRSVIAQRTQSATTYASAVSRRGMMLQTRTSSRPGNRAIAKDINREMTAKQLTKAQKVVAQNPNSSAAREGLALARMAAAVGGSHPKQRVRRRR